MTPADLRQALPLFDDFVRRLAPLLGEDSEWADQLLSTSVRAVPAVLGHEGPAVWATGRAELRVRPEAWGIRNPGPSRPRLGQHATGRGRFTGQARRPRWSSPMAPQRMEAFRLS